MGRKSKRERRRRKNERTRRKKETQVATASASELAGAAANSPNETAPGDSNLAGGDSSKGRESSGHVVPRPSGGDMSGNISEPLVPEDNVSRPNLPGSRIDSYRVRKKIFKGIVAEYDCPHCGTSLFSRENEIGEQDYCAVCRRMFWLDETPLHEYQSAHSNEGEQCPAPKKRRTPSVEVMILAVWCTAVLACFALAVWEHINGPLLQTWAVWVTVSLMVIVLGMPLLFIVVAVVAVADERTRKAKHVQSSGEGDKSSWSAGWVVAGLLLVAAVINLSGRDGAGSGPSDTSLKYVGRQRLESQLKDPDSLEIISEEVVRNPDGSTGYRAKYRAKNSFGGYVVDEFYTE